MSLPLVSILINNFNYARFLSESIESALNQTYPSIEVVVVDDGSIDNSHEIIHRYEPRIKGVFQVNGGQGSALNRGIKVCQGEIICFLDADDTFTVNKVQECVNFIREKNQLSSSILIYHSLNTIDSNSQPLAVKAPGYINFNVPPNSYQEACRYRFVDHFSSPTSGLVITRELANKIFPIPESATRISADTFVAIAASLVGQVYGYQKSLSNYRIHGKNYWYSSTKIHEKDFYLNLEKFLNQKLIENNKKPIISYADSMVAAMDYKRQKANGKLLELAWKVLLQHTDRITWRFFTETHVICLKNWFKNLIGIQRPSL